MLQIYTDGSVNRKNLKYDRPITAGFAATFDHECFQTIQHRVPESMPQEIKIAEGLAVLCSFLVVVKALENKDISFSSIELFCDSDSIVKWLQKLQKSLKVKHHDNRKKTSFTDVLEPETLNCLRKLAKMRVKLQIYKVKSHHTNERNNEVDLLAREATRLDSAPQAYKDLLKLYM